MRYLQEIPMQELMKIKGVGQVKATQLKAMGELTKRMSMKTNVNTIKMRNAKDIADFLMEELRYEKREVVKLLILDAHLKLLKMIDVSYGGSNFATIEPKEILLEAIKMHATRIVLVHNHPSGSAMPSDNDYLVTDRLYEAADLLGIELLDHIVIGDRRISKLNCKNERCKI